MTNTSTFQRVFCCLELCLPWPTHRKLVQSNSMEALQTAPPSPTPTEEDDQDERDEHCSILTSLTASSDSSPIKEGPVSNYSSKSATTCTMPSSLQLDSEFEKVQELRQKKTHSNNRERLRSKIRKSEDRDLEVLLGTIRSPFIHQSDEDEDNGDGSNDIEEELSFNFTNFSDERSDGYSSRDSFHTSDSADVSNGIKKLQIQLTFQSSDLTMPKVDAEKDVDDSSSTNSSNLSFDDDDFGEDEARYGLYGSSFDGSLIASTLLGLSPISEECSEDEDDEDSMTK